MNTLNLLNRLFSEKTLPSALILEGAKQPVIEFCQLLWSHWFCQHNQGCGQCESCLLIAHEHHPDLHFIKPEQDGHAVKIEQVRELLDYAHQTPQIGSFQCVVIESADSMNDYAANALLKILEEPISNFYFILHAKHSSFLLPTIRSRCWLVSLQDENGIEHPTVAQQELTVRFNEVEAAILEYVQHKRDLASLLKFLEGYPLDDVLWLLQKICQHIIQKYTFIQQNEYSLDVLKTLIAIPIQFWWQFWDALIDFRKQLRKQSSFQNQLLLSRLFLILHGIPK
jgi:DNA polymerase-3 subunit delta'